MKKIILILLLLSCSKVIKDINFKNKDINEDLAIAILDDSTDEAIELIEKGANINYIYTSNQSIYNNKTILELSLDNKNLRMVKILLEKDAKLNNDTLIRIYNTKIKYFNYGIIDIIKDKYYLEEGLIDNNKYFLLLCYRSNAEEVRTFIEKHNINPKEIKDKTGRNGLIISAAGDKIDVFKMLIEECELDVNYKNDNGVTPLIVACGRDNKELIELIIEKGANVNGKDKDGDTPLIVASGNFNEEVIEFLIKRGANVNHKANSGWTALMIASKIGHLEVVKLLLEKGANVNDKNFFRWTALILASENGHLEVAKVLIGKEANVNDKDDKGFTALVLASKNGHIEVVKLLLEKGANVYEKDNLEKIALNHVSNVWRNSREKLEKDNFIEIAHMIIRKMADEYIQLFIFLNKQAEVDKEIKEEVHNYITLLYSLQNLPTELLEEIIRKF